MTISDQILNAQSLDELKSVLANHFMNEGQLQLLPQQNTIISIVEKEVKNIDGIFSSAILAEQLGLKHVQVQKALNTLKIRGVLKSRYINHYEKV